MGEKSPKARSLWQRGRWVIYILSGILLLVLLGSFFPRRRERRPQTELLTTPVTAEQLTIRVEGSGAVVPVDTVNLSPKVTGQLEELYVDEGDTVSRGQVLARMDVGSLAAELQQRQAQLVQAEADRDRVVAGSRQEEVRRAQAQVESAEAQVDLTLARLKRFRELVTEGAVSQNELDQYESDARSAAASLEEARQQLEEAVTGSRPEDIAAAQAAVAAAEAQVAITQTQLDDADILAPFSGIVTQIYATVGAIVTPTTSASATAS
ncbi:MAG: biotin/lipoyl-binding protein, partial [Cyanobacteria bacterium P01_A01_bin.135]